MNETFTPNEAAALIEIPPKRIYKEIEYRIIRSESIGLLTSSDEVRHQLSFGALVYLRALKEINFDFSVSYRSDLYAALQLAWKQEIPTLEFGKFFTLNISEVGRELKTLIARFETWKDRLETNPNILGGELVFPNSRLSVRRIGGCLERGETLDVLKEDYPYLTDEDFHFARIYVNAYPIQGRPKIDEIYN